MWNQTSLLTGTQLIVEKTRSANRAIGIPTLASSMVPHCLLGLHAYREGSFFCCLIIYSHLNTYIISCVMTPSLPCSIDVCLYLYRHALFHNQVSTSLREEMTFTSQIVAILMLCT